MEHVDELIAGHALHALSAADEERVALHLAECDRCRRQLREMESVGAALAYAAPPAAPPPQLRERLLAAVEPVVKTPAREPQTRARWGWWPRLSAALVPALTVAFVGAAVWAAALRGDLSGLRGDLRTGTAATLPDVGTVVMLPDGSATLYARLGDPPRGKTYEAWVIHGSLAMPAGTFSSGGEVDLTLPARPGDEVAVTIERAGGSTHPTSPPIGSARLP